ncbi:hypothetical protein ACWGH8_37685 [Nonomuraea muscovyensis]
MDAVRRRCLGLLRTPVLAGVLMAATISCSLDVPLGDHSPRPIGIGRTEKGDLAFFIALCPGEKLSLLSVVDADTQRPVWKVSQAREAMRDGGLLVLGDAAGFAQVETGLALPLPSELAVSAQTDDGLWIESVLPLASIPMSMAGTGLVTDGENGAITRSDFREKIHSRYC